MRKGGLAALLAFSALAVVLAATGGAGTKQEASYEVWLVDQSNTNGTTGGGALVVFDSTALDRRGAAAVPERIDLGGAVTSLCLERTGTAPVRPHMLLFNQGHSHAILSFVASGHVVFFACPGSAPGHGPLAHVQRPWPGGPAPVVPSLPAKSPSAADAAGV